jgi:hypothetical protein
MIISTIFKIENLEFYFEITTLFSSFRIFVLRRSVVFVALLFAVL